MCFFVFNVCQLYKPTKHPHIDLVLQQLNVGYQHSIVESLSCGADLYCVIGWILHYVFGNIQGTHVTRKKGKTRTMTQKKSLSRKTQGIWKFCQNTGKTQGICFAQVVNSLILNSKDILIFATKISKLF